MFKMNEETKQKLIKTLFVIEEERKKPYEKLKTKPIIVYVFKKIKEVLRY